MEFEICLNNLVFYAYHGVFPEERKNGNEFLVDLKVNIPYNSVLKGDNLENTVSYASLFEIVEDEMSRPRHLLEVLAISIIERIRNKFPLIKGGYISIEKKQPPIPGMLGSASVILKF